MSEYDVTEARERIAQFAGELLTANRYEAVKKLRAAIKGVFTSNDDSLVIVTDGTDLNQLFLHFGTTLVGSMIFSSELGVQMRGDGGKGQTVALPLRYDSVTKLFVGSEEDKTRVPVPGQVPPMKNAVTVVVDAVLKLARTAR